MRGYSFFSSNLLGKAFDGITFSNKVDFNEGSLEGAFGANVFEDEVSFSGAEFRSNDIFEFSRFPKGVIFKENGKTLSKVFEGKKFNSKLIFKYGLGTDTSLEGYVFAKDLTFEGTIRGNLSKCTFKGNTTFEKTTFESEATFEGATFGAEKKESEVKFAGCTFTTDISFNETTFHAKADFSECKFEGNINFGKDDFDLSQDKRTYFKKSTNFYNCTFGKKKTEKEVETNISKPTKCTFSGVEFQDAVYFNEATFHSKVRFQHAIFGQSANFENTTFNDLADFYKATFEAAQQFHLTDFMGITILLDMLHKKERKV